MLISIGFESETQSMGFFEINPVNKNLVFSDLMEYVKLTDHISIYGDQLNPNRSIGIHKITPFLQLVNKYKIQNIDIQNSIILKGSSSISDIFNHCEFVTTYSELQEIKDEDILEFIKTHFERSCHEIMEILESLRETVIPIKNISFEPGGTFTRRIKFPYTHFSFLHPYNSHAGILFIEDPFQKGQVPPFHFVFQCTIRIPIEKVIETIQKLDDEMRKCRVSLENTFVKESLSLAYSWIINQEWPQERKVFLYNYFFIFLYAYNSLNHRKKGSAFTFRHTFSNDLSAYISLEEKLKIMDIITDPQLNEYFLKTHLQYMPTYKQKIDYQKMSDVSSPVPSDGQFILIEWRVFNEILKRWYGKQQTNLYAHMGSPMKT